MLRDAPCNRSLGISPRLADNAAPAAFCCFFDFAFIPKHAPLLPSAPAANPKILAPPDKPHEATHPIAQVLIAQGLALYPHDCLASRSFF